MERVDHLLSLTGLGDRKPSELMENMLVLVGSGDACFLFTHLFLRQLPSQVHTPPANSPLISTKDDRGLAEEAHRFLLVKEELVIIKRLGIVHLSINPWSSAHGSKV